MDEAKRTYTAEERAAFVEQYRSWTGTQREFADSVGVAQGTMSKWLAGYGLDGPRLPAGRTCRMPGCGASLEGQRGDALFCSGVCRARWSKARKVGSGALALTTPSSSPAPTFLEVVPVVRPPEASMSDMGSTRLVVDDRVAFVFDRLPPAAWVAQFVTELGRC